MKEPKVGDIWKDIWFDRDGTIKYEDIFVIIETDIPNPRSTNYRTEERGFRKKYLVANSGWVVGTSAWKYNIALSDSVYRKTVRLYGYDTPLYKIIYPKDHIDVK